MAYKYLDETGLAYFWGKLKAYFQPTLVSGTNIKTINNKSLLGSGDIKTPKEIYASTYADFYQAITALSINDTFVFRLEAATVQTLTNNRVTLTSVGFGTKSDTSRVDILFRDGGSNIYAERVTLAASTVTINALNKSTVTSML